VVSILRIFQESSGYLETKCDVIHLIIISNLVHKHDQMLVVIRGM